MLKLFPLALALMVAGTWARPGAPTCTEMMLRIPITAMSYDLDIPPVNNDIDAVAFALDLDTWSSPNITSRIRGVTNVTDTYSIYAQICLPDPAKDKHVMQILSHGLAFDHRYWDIQLHPTQHSYVHAALDAGYTILNYDRLGCGQSQKPDAYKIVQGPLEVEVLRVLTELARHGTLLSTCQARPPFDLPPFPSVVHIGHSFGSAITLALLATYPDLSTAAISTGFIIATHPNQDSSTSFGFEYAASNDRSRFSDRGSGYIVPSSPSALQTSFLHRTSPSDPAGSTDEMLVYADGIKQPLSVAEWASIRGLLNVGLAPGFTGSLQFLLAEWDFLICDGDCKGNYNETLIRGLYPQAGEVGFYVQPGAGHGLTLQRNASAGYQVMFGWLGGRGS